MAKAIKLPYPPRWVNAYVAAKLGEYEDTGVGVESELVPIFATKPGNTDEIWKQLVDNTSQTVPLLIQYDRLMRFRSSPLYEIKKEQLVYYLYSNSLSVINNAVIVISQILDREDVAAQEINKWASENPQTVNGEVLPYNVFFHRVKVYQVDEVRDLLDLASARATYVNKIIIEYDYHPKWFQSETDTDWLIDNGDPTSPAVQLINNQQQQNLT